MTEVKRTAIETFCGAGGMSLGLLRAGFDVRLAFDNDSSAVDTYTRNISDHCRIGDARIETGEGLLREAGLESGDLDLLSGGPPCQGFSKQRRYGRFIDERNDLVLEFSRLVKESAPKAFLFENVQMFGQKRGREYIKNIIEYLNEYSVFRYYVCCSDFGLAQSRGRFLMIGVRREISNSVPVLSRSATKQTVRDVISGLPSPPEDCTEHPDLPNHIRCRISKANEERIAHVPQGGGWQDIPWELRLPCHQTESPKTGGWPDVYGRLEWDGVCPTLTGGFDSFSRGRYAHPEENRSITPREAALLQGFPLEFAFSGNRGDVRRQIGNAVPPPLAKAAGNAISRVLDGCLDAPAHPLFPEGCEDQLRLAV